MPYITCDGKTYSRYDNSPYVQECIAKQNAYYDSLYKACTLDPHCKHEREKANSILNSVAVIGLIFIILCIIKLIKIIAK